MMMWDTACRNLSTQLDHIRNSVKNYLEIGLQLLNRTGRLGRLGAAFSGTSHGLLGAIIKL